MSERPTVYESPITYKEIRERFPNFDLLVEEMGEEEALRYVSGEVMGTNVEVSSETLLERMTILAQRAIQYTPDELIIDRSDLKGLKTGIFIAIDENMTPSRFWVNQKQCHDVFVVIRSIPLPEENHTDQSYARITPAASMLDVLVVSADGDHDLAPIRINSAYIQMLSREEALGRLSKSMHMFKG